jgi:flagellar hook assembly protein FlgD
VIAAQAAVSGTAQAMAVTITAATQAVAVSVTAATQPAIAAQSASGFPMSFELSQSAAEPAEVMVFPAAKGRALKVLHGDAAVQGKAKLVWDGRDEQGNTLPAGRYFLRLRSSNEESIQEVVIP